MNRVLTALFFAALIAVAGACKPKLNTAKYAPVCDKIMKCAKAASSPLLQVGDSSEKCATFFAKAESKKQLASALPKIVECVNEQPCEKLDMNACVAKALQGMQIMLPGQ